MTRVLARFSLPLALSGRWLSVCLVDVEAEFFHHTASPNIYTFVAGNIFSFIEISQKFSFRTSQQ